VVCKCSTRWKGLSFAVLENNSFEIMPQDCHSHGKISEFVSEVKCLVHIVQVENEDKVDSKKAKGNVNVHHFSLPKGQWKVRDFLTFWWVATRSCKILTCFYTQVVGKFNRALPERWFSVKKYRKLVWEFTYQMSSVNVVSEWKKCIWTQWNSFQSGNPFSSVSLKINNSLLNFVIQIEMTIKSFPFNYQCLVNMLS